MRREGCQRRKRDREREREKERSGAARADIQEGSKGRRRRRRFFAEGVVLVTSALYRTTEPETERALVQMLLILAGGRWYRRDRFQFARAQRLRNSIGKREKFWSSNFCADST